MDFSLSAIDDMFSSVDAAAVASATVAPSPNAASAADAALPPQLAWPPGHDFAQLPLSPPTTSAAPLPQHHHQHEQQRHVLASAPAVTQVSALHAPVNDDSQDDDMSSSDEGVGPHAPAHSSSASHSSADAPPLAAGASDAAAPPPGLTLGVPVHIDPVVVLETGGLQYAELCKERAREAFKEAKKREHLANGNFDRIRRRRRNDASTPQQRRRRRLQMNQDSAAAARYAQDVYVDMLTKLVKLWETERPSFVLQIEQLRMERDQLNDRVQNLTAKVDMLEGSNAKGESQSDLYPKYDQAQLAKILDMITAPTTVGAQPDMGVRPAPAV